MSPLLKTVSKSGRGLAVGGMANNSPTCFKTENGAKNGVNQLFLFYFLDLKTWCILIQRTSV